MDILRNRLRLSICLVVFAGLLLGATGSVVAADGPKWIGAFYVKVKGQVGLKWKKVEGATEYVVYRKATDEEFAKLASTAKTQHFDTEITPGTEYTYKVAAIVADGSEAIGPEKKVNIPGAKIGAFVPPKWSGARVDRRKIFLNWDRVTGVMAYNIYRSETAGTGYDVVGNATGNRYADEDDLVKGVTYYYVITALNDEFEETEFSEEKAVKYGMSAEERAALSKKDEVVLEDLKMTLLFSMKTAGSAGKLNQPTSIFVDQAGNIYCSDPMNSRLVSFDKDGEFLTEIGDPCPRDQYDAPPEGTLISPSFITGDNNGNLYVCDPKSHMIHVFKTTGEFVRRFGADVPDKGKAFSPNGIGVASDGKIVVSDTPNHRYFIFDNNGSILKELGEQGEEPGQLNYPGAITLVGDTIIAMVDIIGARIQQFDFDGKFISGFGEVGSGPGYFGRPAGISWDGSKFWVADLMISVVQSFTQGGGVKNAFKELTGAGIELKGPASVEVKNGRMYIANSLSNEILVIQL